MQKLTIGDIMWEHPIKVKDSISVGSVAHLLLRYRINGILVVRKNNENKLVGVFTVTDILRMIDKILPRGTKRIEELKRIAKIPVGKVATKRVFSLQKSAKFLKAVALMHKKHIHTIPIYDKNKLVGVIGRHDILNMALNYTEA